MGRIANALDARRVPFMVIGGQAVLVHGEPRLTQDIDITLGAGPARLPDVVAACEMLGLQPLPDDVRTFVQQTFVLPASDPDSGIRVDLIFSTTPYEAHAITRAVSIDLGGRRVPFASAEDLILHKLFAARPRDLEDALGVVRRKGDGLDWAYMERWASDLGAVEGRGSLPSMLAALRERE